MKSSFGVQHETRTSLFYHNSKTNWIITVDAPRYGTDKVIMHNIPIPHVFEVIELFSDKYSNLLDNHPNTLANKLLRSQNVKTKFNK